MKFSGICDEARVLIETSCNGIRYMLQASMPKGVQEVVGVNIDDNKQQIDSEKLLS